MKPKNLLQTDILDIIFDQRNKEYGAYELRKNYQLRAKKALTFSLVIVLVAISAPLIAGFMSNDPDVVFTGPKGPTILTDIPVPPPPKLPKPHTSISEPPKSLHPTPPVIVRANEDLNPPKPDPAIPVSPPQPSGPQVPGDPIIGIAPNGPSGPLTILADPVKPETTYTEINVEQQPEFPGGEEALMAYLSSHIHYPAKAIEKEASGKVVLGFVVNKNGEIDELKVVRTLGYGCDEEAMRVVGAMPKWKPGKNNGKAVNVYFNLPIIFEMK